MASVKPEIWVGIDPDVEKSGVAVWDSNEKSFDSIQCLSFFDTIETIKLANEFYSTLVIIEAGWLIKKSNWHGANNKNVAAKIGTKVGANHQVGKLLAEYCMNNNLPYILTVPQGKRNAREFKCLTGWQGRTNSEHRDAALLVFGR